jgi:inositol-phosphate transport system ATP-binding protein
MDIKLENFSKSFGKVEVITDLDLVIKSGEMIALLGPSGCGKTTTLFAICGIHRITKGQILFGDRVINDVPTQERNVGVVFQNYALYPHLTIFENIAFPLRIRKMDKSEIDKQVKEFAEMVGIENLLDRMPMHLSGGQQQRVALVRALVRKPDVLLMDEPLANLDATLRLRMRSEIRRIQQDTGITAILVTHDQVEAMSMCDRIAIMNDGKIQQISNPADMYSDPMNTFVAGFIGNPPISFYDGTLQENSFVGTAMRFKLSEAELSMGLREGQELKIGVRPEFVQPDFGDEIQGNVSFVEPQGRETLYDIELEDGHVIRSIQVGSQQYQLGEAIQWGMDHENILLFDGDGDKILS